jgi:hypothetical protein
MKPLDPSLLDVSEPDRWESGLQKIPVLGWIFAQVMFQDRIRPLVKDIKKQLKEREGFDVRPFWAEEDWRIA